MIELPYSLVIEATEDPTFFGFYSPVLGGFTGVGHSVEDCLYQARWGMREHIELLHEQGLPVPPTDPDPTITVRNESRRPDDYSTSRGPGATNTAMGSVP